MEVLEDSKRLGRFSIGPGKYLHGELTFARSNTALYLWDENDFNVEIINEQTLTGVLDDLSSVTLIDCVSPVATNSLVRGDQQIHSASIFPHYVILGDHHIDPAKMETIEVRFSVDDTEAIFYDFEAFGGAFNAGSIIDQVVQSKKVISRRPISCPTWPRRPKARFQKISNWRETVAAKFSKSCRKARSATTS